MSDVLDPLALMKIRADVADRRRQALLKLHKDRGLPQPGTAFPAHLKERLPEDVQGMDIDDVLTPWDIDEVESTTAEFPELRRTAAPVPQRNWRADPSGDEGTFRYRPKDIAQQARASVNWTMADKGMRDPNSPLRTPLDPRLMEARLAEQGLMTPQSDTVQLAKEIDSYRHASAGEELNKENARRQEAEAYRKAAEQYELERQESLKKWSR